VRTAAAATRAVVAAGFCLALSAPSYAPAQTRGGWGQTEQRTCDAARAALPPIPPPPWEGREWEARKDREEGALIRYLLASLPLYQAGGACFGEPSTSHIAEFQTRRLASLGVTLPPPPRATAAAPPAQPAQPARAPAPAPPPAARAAAAAPAGQPAQTVESAHGFIQFVLNDRVVEFEYDDFPHSRFLSVRSAPVTRVFSYGCTTTVHGRYEDSGPLSRGIDWERVSSVYSIGRSVVVNGSVRRGDGSVVSNVRFAVPFGYETRIADAMTFLKNACNRSGAYGF